MRDVARSKCLKAGAGQALSYGGSGAAGKAPRASKEPCSGARRPRSAFARLVPR